jgi:hypothetical protein
VQVNAKMKAELRHIVLLLDNAPTHPPDTTEVPFHVTVHHRSHTTSSHSIRGIAAFKAHYRAQLVQFVISSSTETPT